MDLKEILKKQREAKTEPSDRCIEGKEHNFKFTCHADGRDFYINYSTCEHCGEMIKEEHERDELGKLLWS